MKQDGGLHVATWVDEARAIIRGAKGAGELRTIAAMAGLIKAEAEGAIFDDTVARLVGSLPGAAPAPASDQAITFKQAAAETGFKEWALREAGRRGPDHGGLRTLRNGSRGVLVQRKEVWRFVKSQERSGLC
jgi:hypothetical protein